MNDQSAQFSITDLAVLKNIIDLACNRGAFQASEMKTVGEVYEKLSVFLEAVIKQAEADIVSGQQGETK